METTIIGTKRGEIFCGTWYKRQEIENEQFRRYKHAG